MSVCWVKQSLGSHGRCSQNRWKAHSTKLDCTTATRVATRIVASIKSDFQSGWRDRVGTASRPHWSETVKNPRRRQYRRGEGESLAKSRGRALTVSGQKTWKLGLYNSDLLADPFI